MGEARGRVGDASGGGTRESRGNKDGRRKREKGEKGMQVGEGRGRVGGTRKAGGRGRRESRECKQGRRRRRRGVPKKGWEGKWEEGGARRCQT